MNTRKLRRVRSTLRSRRGSSSASTPPPAQRRGGGAPVTPEADRDQDQPEHEDPGEDEEGQDAQVRPAVEAHQLEAKRVRNRTALTVVTTAPAIPNGMRVMWARKRVNGAEDVLHGAPLLDETSRRA